MPHAGAAFMDPFNDLDITKCNLLLVRVRSFTLI